MTSDDLKALMEYVYEEEMCVYPEGQNYDCVSCELCRVVFIEKVRRENNL